MKIMKKKRNLNDLSEQLLEKMKSVSKFNECQTELLSLIIEFPGNLTEQKLIGIDEESEDYEAFGDKRFTIILENVLKLNGLTEDNALLEALFNCEGCSISMFRESLYTLLDSIKTTNWPSRKLDLLIDLLVKLCTKDCFLTLLLRASFHFDKIIEKCGSNFCNLEQILQTFTTIPERIANKTKGKLPEQLKLEYFSKLIFLNLAKSLGVISLAPKEIKVNTKPISMALSFSANFTRYDSAKHFIRLLSVWAETRVKFQTILMNVIKDLNQKAIEPFLILILQTTDYPNKFLASTLIKNQSWNYIICKKLSFLSYNSDNILISNLVKYLICTENIEEMLIDLVKIWSDKSALTHTAFEQHLYITKLIILIFKSIPDKVTNNETVKASVMTSLLEGISVHLDSTVDVVRALGMATGEIVINILNYNPENQLKFDYSNIKQEQEEIVTLLKTYDFHLNVINTSEDVAFKYLEASNEVHIMNKSDKTKILNVKGNEENEKKVEEEILDSDDEFEPYDTSNDLKQSIKKRPKYLRDLIEGLLEQKDGEIFAESLQYAEELIYKQLPDDDVSIGIELMHILCCLDEQFFVENFTDLKFNASLAILLIQPKETAEFLCEQFHAPNYKYSICQKLVFLELLSAGATTLSNLGTKQNALNKFKQNNSYENNENKNLKSLLKMKIIGKTRKLTSATKLNKNYVNEFNKTAGSFFFPLIRGKETAITVLYKPQSGRDNSTLLLVSLLRTLAIIITASVNLGQLVVRMSSELFEAIWCLRYHSEIKVREAVINCIAAIVLSVPEVSLFNSDLYLDLLEARQWLIDLISTDVNNVQLDENFKMYAAQVVLFIDQNISLEKLLQNAIS